MPVGVLGREPWPLGRLCLVTNEVARLLNGARSMPAIWLHVHPNAFGRRSLGKFRFPGSHSDLVRREGSLKSSLFLWGRFGQCTTFVCETDKIAIKFGGCPLAETIQGP